MFSDVDIDKLHESGIRGARFNMVAESGGTRNLSLIERVTSMVMDSGCSLTIHTKPDGLIQNASWLASMKHLQ
ncbi:MAG: hypothetical protein VX700_11915 [Pseudomonadota bacterium]|nr:hypothetical protein [Pseudomonadota bacterium]